MENQKQKPSCQEAKGKAPQHRSGGHTAQGAGHIPPQHFGGTSAEGHRKTTVSPDGNHGIRGKELMK